MLGRPIYVFVDSDYAVSGSAGNFQYKLNLPTGVEFDSVTCLQGSFAKSYYQVRAGMNTLTLTEGAAQQTITMTPGNYSMTSFRLALNLALNNASVANGNSYTYVITQPSVATQVSTGKYTYSVSGNGGTQPIISFPISSLLYVQCGFKYNSSNTFVVNSLISVNVVNFAAITGMVIKSSIVDGIINTGIHGNGILQEILQFNTYDFSNIGFQNSNAEMSAKPLKKAETTIANFVITDLDDQELDFNGGSVNFTLVFFQRDTTADLTVRDIKMRWYNDLLTQPKTESITASKPTASSTITVSSEPVTNIEPSTIPTPEDESKNAIRNPSMTDSQLLVRLNRNAEQDETDRFRLIVNNRGSLLTSQAELDQAAIDAANQAAEAAPQLNLPTK